MSWFLCRLFHPKKYGTVGRWSWWSCLRCSRYSVWRTRASDVYLPAEW